MRVVTNDSYGPWIEARNLVPQIVAQSYHDHPRSGTDTWDPPSLGYLLWEIMGPINGNANEYPILQLLGGFDS